MCTESACDADSTLDKESDAFAAVSRLLMKFTQVALAILRGFRIVISRFI